MMTGVGVILGTAAYMCAGAGEGTRGGQAQRHLGVRVRAVRDADGQARVRRRRRRPTRSARCCESEPDWTALPADDARRRFGCCCECCLEKDRRSSASPTSRRRCSRWRTAHLETGRRRRRAAATRCRCGGASVIADGRCAGDRRRRRRRRCGSPRARRPVPPRVSRLPGRAVGCRRADDQRRRPRPGDHAGRLTRRLRWQPRHAALRPRARCARAGGGVHWRAARAICLPRWSMDRVRGRRQRVEEGGGDRRAGGHAGDARWHFPRRHLGAG